MRKPHGLTFLELGIVMLLIFVLIISMVFLFGAKWSQARDAARIEKARKIENLLLDTFIIEGSYPSKEAFEQILTSNKLLDQKAGESVCYDGDDFVRDCEYVYETGNRWFDFLLVVWFESKKFVNDLYEAFEWNGDIYHGLIKSTKKLDL